MKTKGGKQEGRRRGREMGIIRKREKKRRRKVKMEEKRERCLRSVGDFGVATSTSAYSIFTPEKVPGGWRIISKLPLAV